MIRFIVEIDTAPFEGNEFGVGVRVVGDTDLDVQAVPEGEGATLIGIGMAINDYMRSRGAPQFNCLKGLIDV